MADYLIVDSPRHPVPIGDLDPATAVPLTDAGLTPYHAIRRSLATLRPGGWMVVIGAGGLGHLAIQLLKVLTSARVLVVDRRQDQLDHASSIGADAAVAGVGPDVAIVGIGDPAATAKIGWGRQAHEVAVCATYWGGRHELRELVDLAHHGVLDVAVERFSLDDGVEAYRRMSAGTLTGRAVVLP